jgi:hypothetical protein
MIFAGIMAGIAILLLRDAELSLQAADYVEQQLAQAVSWY